MGTGKDFYVLIGLFFWITFKQCGGITFTGPTTCVAGWVCTYSNPYHSQCLQYSSTTATTTPAPTPTTTYTPLPTLSPEPGWGYVNGDVSRVTCRQSGNVLKSWMNYTVDNWLLPSIWGSEYRISRCVQYPFQCVPDPNRRRTACAKRAGNATVCSTWGSCKLYGHKTRRFVVHRACNGRYIHIDQGLRDDGHPNIRHWKPREWHNEFLCSLFIWLMLCRQGFLLCQAAEGDYYDFFLNLDSDTTPPGCTNETVLIYLGSIAV